MRVSRGRDPSVFEAVPKAFQENHKEVQAEEGMLPMHLLLLLRTEFTAQQQEPVSDKVGDKQGPS